MDNIILVDEQDNEIGYGEKMEVHQKGLLHRAFSIFMIDCRKKKILLQRRAYDKYHSGGLWTNACCSHPRKGENMSLAISSRIKEELGIVTNLRIIDRFSKTEIIPNSNEIYFVGTFLYYALLGELSEHEIDYVYVYFVRTEDLNSKINFNPKEIAEIRWVSINQLNEWLIEEPNDFTAWFETAYKMVLKIL